MATNKVKFSIAIQSDAYKNLINNTLGDKEIARQFIADMSTVVSTNQKLQECEPATIISACLVAQSLKLPLSQTLGFAYIIPYKDKAQFQIGYKGLIQLSQRTGLFKTIGVREVHKGEHNGQNKYGDDVFKFSHDFDNEEVIGYYAYFELLNGFEKTWYMTKEQAEKHATKYSSSHKNAIKYNNFNDDLWSGDSFDSMACKTALKLLLGKYAPMSVELQKAILSDQAVIKDDGTYEYVDNLEEDTTDRKSTINNTIDIDEEDIPFEETSDK